MSLLHFIGLEFWQTFSSAKNTQKYRLGSNLVNYLPISLQILKRLINFELFELFFKEKIKALPFMIMQA